MYKNQVTVTVKKFGFRLFFSNRSKSTEDLHVRKMISDCGVPHTSLLRLTPIYLTEPSNAPAATSISTKRGTVVASSSSEVGQNRFCFVVDTEHRSKEGRK